MDGGCIRIWLKNRLTLNQRLLLQKYECFLIDYGIGYSFDYEFRQPEINTKFERNQIKSQLGFVPEQEILICSLADPMFRTAEAIMKYFTGYYVSTYKDDLRQAEGKHYVIKRRNKFGITVFAYHLHDWVFISNYFNVLDDQKIKNLYSIERFKKNEFERLWKSKPNYGISFN